MFLGSQCTRFIIVSDNSCAQEVNVFGDGQMFGARSVRLTVRSRTWRWAGKTKLPQSYHYIVHRRMCVYICITYIFTFIRPAVGTGFAVHWGGGRKLRARHGKNWRGRPVRVREKHEVQPNVLTDNPSWPARCRSFRVMYVCVSVCLRVGRCVCACMCVCVCI